jgi:hypothetical protein
MFSGSKSTSRDNKTVGCRKSALDAHTIAQSHAHIFKRENLKYRVIRPLLEYELSVETCCSCKNGDDYVAIVDVKLYLGIPTVVH